VYFLAPAETSKDQPMRCGIYTRVSTDTQSEVEFNSCESQKEQILTYVKSQNDLEVVKVYTDAGYTGSNLNRPALQNLLNDITLGKIDCVLVYKVDRLTRLPKDFYYLIEYFEKYGVSFISTTQRFDTSTATGRLIRNIMLDFAQFEREMTVERTKDKMYQRAGKGLWNGGIPPYGYIKSDKKLIIDEKEVKCIKDIYDVFLQTQSLAETRRYINGKYETRSGKDFAKSTIFDMLRNPVYMGKIRYGEKVYDGEHEPIIPEAKYLKVQTLLKVHVPKLETKIDRDYLLTGLIRCGECGSIMTPTYTKKNRGEGESKYTYYYRCTKTYQHNWNACSIRSVNAEKVENYVIDRLKDFSRDRGLIEGCIEKINTDEEGRISELDEKKKQIEKGLQKVEAQINHIVDVLAEGGERFSVVKAKLEELENRKKVLLADLNEIKMRIENENLTKYDSELVIKNLQDFSDRIDYSKGRDRKHLLQMMIKDIIYGRQDITLNLFYLPAINESSKNRSELLPLLNKFRTIPIRIRNEIINSHVKR
jgi:site-specific DNA recombinase